MPSFTLEPLVEPCCPKCKQNDHTVWVPLHRIGIPGTVCYRSWCKVKDCGGEILWTFPAWRESDFRAMSTRI